ncbi:YhgE/Pip domain-containing protein, partial [Enterococcus faecalis]
EIIQQVQTALPDIRKLGDQANDLGNVTLDGATQLEKALPGITQSVGTILKAIGTISAGVNTALEDLKNHRLPVEEREAIKQQLSESLGKQHENIQQLIQLFTQMQEATGSEALQQTIDNLSKADIAILNVKSAVDGIDVNAVTDKRLEEIQNEAQQIANFVSEKNINPDAVENTVKTILDKLIATIQNAQGQLNKAQQIDFEGLLSSTSQTVTNAISLLEKYQAEMPAIKQ